VRQIQREGADTLGMIDVDALLARNDGLILARDHRRLKSSLSRWVRQGRLVRLMRGVYAHPARRLGDRLRAVSERIPGGVIAGQTAMSLGLGLSGRVETIDVCTPTRRRPQPGYRFCHRSIPGVHVSRGVMVPALAAVDLSDDEPGWLDDLARRRWATCEQFRRLLEEFPNRRGNVRRRRHIERTSTSPWSVAERRYHDLFDRCRVTGWVANQPVRAGGAWFAPDVAFRAERPALEIDGRQFHRDAAAFEADRRRQNEFAAAGWTVLRFTWAMLDDPEWVIATVRTVLTRLRRQRRRDSRNRA